jgi:type IV pilus assembly protein PilB
MGVEPFLVTSAVTCILAQRLVRRLCQRCKEPYQPLPEELASAGWNEAIAATVEAPQFFRQVGCGSCSRSGYRGRFAIHEVMPLTEDITQLVLNRSSSDVVQQLAIDQGMVPLREDGLRKVASGSTTLEELFRVVT